MFQHPGIGPHHPARRAALDPEPIAEEGHDQMPGIVARVAFGIADHRNRRLGPGQVRGQRHRFRTGGMDLEEGHVRLARARDPEDAGHKGRAGGILGRVDLFQRVQSHLDPSVELALLELPVLAHPAPREKLCDMAVGHRDAVIDQPAGPGIFAKPVEQVQPPRRHRPGLDQHALCLEQIAVVEIEIHPLHQLPGDVRQPLARTEDPVAGHVEGRPQRAAYDRLDRRAGQRRFPPRPGQAPPLLRPARRSRSPHRLLRPRSWRAG